MSTFVGRASARARLTAAYRAAVTAAAGSLPGRPGLVLVTGEAGIGKTALLTRFAADAAADGATVLWGTCWDEDQAPAWWPWTQVFRTLLRQDADLRAGAPPDLAAVAPDLVGSPGQPPGADGAGRVRIFDAAGQTLGRAGTRAPAVVILDDLQWADASTIDLLRFTARQALPGAVTLVGAYRPGEVRADIAAGLADLTAAAELVTLRGLGRDEISELVRTLSGPSAGNRWAALVHERSGGHPFFARELCRLLTAGGTGGEVPAAVREVIGRRLAGLPAGCTALLAAAAVTGNQLLPDVLAEVCGDPAAVVADRIDAVTAAGIVVPDGPAGGARFAHDLFRETVYTGLPAARRLDLHARVAGALVRRHERGAPVFPAELARQFAAAVPVTGTAPALAWAHAAADADRARYAFAEAAGHLTRLRHAVAAAGARLSDAELVGVLTTEADLRLRSGDAAAARSLLDGAWQRAGRTGNGDLLAPVALGMDRVGARFAMPRTELIAVLDTARRALSGRGTAAEAQVTAALARQLQHSVPADRPQARPLAETAVAIARRLDDPATLATCLLAQHDAVWTVGTADQRAAIAAEIAAAARAPAGSAAPPAEISTAGDLERPAQAAPPAETSTAGDLERPAQAAPPAGTSSAGDPERLAQAALLSATALLESGSAGFRAALADFAYQTARLRQPRHDYLLRTRQAALALLDGDVEAGDRLSAEAVALGEAAGDTDTGNVRMTQRLEIVRARGNPADLCDLAAAAVSWWVGLPTHAHAVAAGFFARAGDLDRARRELDTVLALDEWRRDRSYMWSLYAGELTAAAIALADHRLCRQLLDDLLPYADTCAVGGALVVFMGAHAHRVGQLHAALGEPEPAARWLTRAVAIHRRLGAPSWEAESRAALAALTTGPPPAPAAAGGARLRRRGELWEASYRGRSALVRDTKGLRDLATLLARPGADVPALELAGPGGPREASAGAPVLDGAALAAYRRRLADLDDQLAAARADGDRGRLERATQEREFLLAELRRATRPGGAARRLGPTAAERARKAVSARIREAIRRIGAVLPELGTHLDRTVRTGTTCRYDPGPG